MTDRRAKSIARAFVPVLMYVYWWIVLKPIVLSMGLSNTDTVLVVIEHVFMIAAVLGAEWVICSLAVDVWIWHALKKED